MPSLSAVLLILAMPLVLGACCATCCDDCEEAPVLREASLGSTPNVHALGEIYTAGQPGADDLRLAAEQGFATIISTRTPGEIDLDEAALAAELGLTFHNPGFRSPDALTDERFAEMRQLLQTADQPILFHCGSANRVGAHWLAWRVLDGGLTIEEATAEAETVGLRSPPLKARALEYIAAQQAGEG